MVKTACSCAALVHLYWTAQCYTPEGSELYNNYSENSDLTVLLLCVITRFQNFRYVCTKESQNMYAGMQPEVLKDALQAGKCVIKPGWTVG
jgi:hypothetical protein